VPDAGPFQTAFHRNALQYSTTPPLPTLARRLLIGLVVAKSPATRYLGGVVEWLMAPVLKFEFNILD
jgi:hypothetical protein